MNIVFFEKKYSSGYVKAQTGIFFKDNDFIPGFLSPEELEILNGFKARKKQIEWLAGRCLIKQMVQKFIHSSGILSVQNFDISQEKLLRSREAESMEQTPPREPTRVIESAQLAGSAKLAVFLKNGIKMCDINIAHHEEGAPFFKKWPFLKISISHSGSYAAACLCTIKGREPGLDIEKIGKMPDSFFMKIAFTEKEIADMQHCPEDFFTRWTMKEAFLKYIKKGFNESLHKVEILDGRIFHNGKKASVSIFSRIIENQTGDRYSLSLVS